MEVEISQFLDGIKAVFLDLDGTIYLGDSLIDGALDFLGRLETRGIKRYFLSNNSSKSVEQYLGKLRDLGIDADKDESVEVSQLLEVLPLPGADFLHVLTAGAF